MENNNSSDFIIALKNTEENKKFAKICMDSDCCGMGRIIQNENELSEFLINYTYKDNILEVLMDDYGQRLFSKISEVIDSDFMVIYAEIDVYDDLHGELLCFDIKKNNDKYLIEVN